ncbi:hypothetical protein ABL850_14855 [Variovorax paradoxus]|uniref:hypothetical protein n=1 Tax=Variovorax paradoxus TaxID=34073 RepID=UPI0004235072
MLTFFYSVTGISSVVGALLLAFTIVGSQSAPQQAAGAAMAIGLAIVPYVFSRCIQIIVSETYRREESAKLVTHLIAVEAAIAKTGTPRQPVRAPVVDKMRAN